MSDLPHQIIRLSDLAQRRATDVAFQPDAADRAAIRDALDLSDLRKLRFDGTLTPQDRSDWRLTGQLGATVVQPCGVTLAPVTTRIDEDIARTYTAHFDTPEAGEVEMPEDDTVEPLPATIDVAAIVIEALSLALPPFPRAPEAEPLALSVTEPGKAPMTDDEAKPFAGLAALRDKLSKDDGGEPEK